MINVSKPYLPPFNEYADYLQQIWSSSRLTNQGPLVSELENRLKEHADVVNVQFVTSGTVALSIAIKSLDLKGEVITTAFSHVSGLNAIIMAGCKPVFVDIEERTYCIDPDKIEAAITSETSAILATHVYGYACDVEKIYQIAKKHQLKVIYDGAHAFGVEVNNQSIFHYGDVSIVSLHATKFYHSVEGGAVYTNDPLLAKKIELIKTFGLKECMPVEIGTNGKNSEFHAAMGLCNLSRVQEFIEKKKVLSLLYKSMLGDTPLEFPVHQPKQRYNYAYFPVVFPSEYQMLHVKEVLAQHDVFARRYFFPSLNKSPYVSGEKCPIAERISERVLCFPLYYDLSLEDVEYIAGIIVKYYS
jgi:dTDP-4-amino-4,6-dideoxygalactose transaminase